MSRHAVGPMTRWGATARRASTGLLVAVAVVFPTCAGAQLANASATALALGGNVTATAREFSAIAANPAGLGMSGSGFSIALPGVQVRSGLGPISTANLADVEGVVVPAETKEEWLVRVAEAGGQSGSFGADANELALTIGNFGLQVSTVAAGRLNLGPGVVETLLYGNAGRTGMATDIALAGSSVRTSVFTTAAGSFAFGLPVVSGEMAVGATIKYTVGHFVAVAEEQGGAITADPLAIAVEFPVLQTGTDSIAFDNGHGIGVDLGMQWKRDALSLGVVAQNLFNTFEWATETLVYRPGTVDFEQGSNESDFDPQPADGAPEGLRAEVAGMGFEPTLAVGAALDVGSRLTVSMDVKKRFGEGFDLSPEFQTGFGAELRLPLLRLRGGATVITDGVQYSGGASLGLLGINLSVGAALQKTDLYDVGLVQVTVSLFGQ